MQRRILITLFALAPILIACGGDDESPTSTANDSPSTSDVVGLSNPASEFCIERGGRLDIVEEAGGQVGYCNLPDGSRVEEWEYFLANNDDSGG